MARIPDQELERLKREVSLARLIEGQGHRLISQGLPLRDALSPRRPTCGTALACDAGGSVIDWIMRAHKVSFRHACELLAKQHPALMAADRASTQRKISKGKLRQAQSFSLEDGDQGC